MNYLAHAYLSFNNTEILVGNMISDYVKGKKKFDYPTNILHGIMLHRDIDTYTDDHAAVKEAKQYFKPSVGPYAGALVDVSFDHFLALDQNEFATNGHLLGFAMDTYTRLQDNFEILPAPFQKMLPYMQSQNWLYNYQYSWGIENSFNGVARRAKYLENIAAAFHAFQAHHNNLKECYNNFFPDLKSYTKNRLELLLNT